MAEDSLEDLFNKFFGDILGSESNPFSRQDPRRNASFETDPRRNALFETFRGEIEKGDKTYLKRAVVEYQSEVYGRGSDADLMQVYAKACVFVENIQVGYESLHRIKDPSSKQKQAMGILAYEMGKPQEAIDHLKEVEDKVSTARIVYSLSLHSQGDRDCNSHSRLLEPLFEKSSLANTILGTLYFNSGETVRAEEFFDRSVQLAPNSERDRLNLMRAKVSNGKMAEVYANMNEFYVETGSNLSVEEVGQELERKEVEIPPLKIRNLFPTIKKLLA